MILSGTFFVFMIMFVFNCKTQNAADRVRDHPFLVRMNDANSDPAGIRGNQVLIRRVFIHSSLQTCPPV